jgi:DNA-binding LytR/AlgR family response regulator
MPDIDPAGSLALALAMTEDDTLAMTIGYATLDADADVRRHRNSLTGLIADKIRRVLSVVRLAGSDGAAGLAALEILSWIFFPAIASSPEAGRGLADKIAQWNRSALPALSVLILVPQTVAAASSKSLELDRAPVSIVTLNTDLFNRLMLAG